MPMLGHWYMLFLVVAFWGVIIGLVVWAIRSLRPSGDRSAGALSILNERFARGEIDQQEYEQRKAALQRS